MKSRNSGFTIVELIVVMLIIGIITVIAGLSVSTSTAAKTQRTAASIDSLISKCRTDTLGRSGSVYLTLSLDSNGDIVCTHSDGTNVSADTFSGKGISVTYQTTITPSVALTSSNSLTLSFNRSTGGLNMQSGAYCTSIIFTGGRTYTIVLVPSTGNHSLT